jgi:hypothetical protein
MPGQIQTDDHFPQTDGFLLPGKEGKKAVSQEGAVVEPFGMTLVPACLQGPSGGLFGDALFHYENKLVKSVQRHYLLKDGIEYHAETPAVFFLCSTGNI